MNRHKRKLNKRRRKSNWAIRRARLRLWANRRPPPANAHVALAIPNQDNEPELAVSRGFSRLVTITALGSVVILAGAIAYLLQFRSEPTANEVADNVPAESEQVGAETLLDPTETPIPTLEPTSTPTPTATPIIIELTPQPAVDPLAGGGSVVYALHRNGNSDLYALAVGQDGLIQLTNDAALDEAPAWSPDGRQIAFASQRSGNDDIFILDLQSGDVKQMTSQVGYDGNPSWSPDGEWLVYESYQNDNLDIYILRVDLSQEPIQITKNPGPDRAPDWSPDGREIIWSGMRQNNFELWLMSLDTVSDSQAINLTNTADIDEADPKFDGDSQRLSWSGRTKDDNRLQIRIGRFAENRQLETNTLVGEGKSPAWSPAGDTLIWSSETANAGVLQIGAINSFGIVPQSYVQDGLVGRADWAGINLASQPAGWLTAIQASAQPPLFTETIEEPLATATPEATENESLDETPTDENGEASTQSTDESAADAPAPSVTLRRVLTNDELGLLSDSVDQSFLALRSRIEFETGIDILSDVQRMFVPLNAANQPGESDELWHRAGRAFDINNELALGFSPIFEVVRRDERDQTFWDVYVRTAAQDGTQGRPMVDIPWDFRSRFGDNPVDYDEGGRLKDGIPAGYYVNLTALARDYGWESVPAERNWRTFYPGVRFWQFEKRDNLTWEQAMLEIYTPNELDNR